MIFNPLAFCYTEWRKNDRIEKILDTFLLDENCIYPSQLISSSENITQLFEAL